MIRWSDKGDSFVIENIQDFEKILPRYFNTKNYSSFVRQLNMYQFQKRRTDNELHEFYHVNFLRREPEKISLIRRKSNPSVSIQRLQPRSSVPVNSMIEKIAELGQQIKSMQSALEQMQLQNKFLAEMNKELFLKLSLSKGFSFAKLQKLLLIFFVLVEDYNPRCVYGLKIGLFRSDIVPSQNQLEMFDLIMRMKNYVDNLIQQIADTELMTSDYLDKIFDTFCAYLSDKNKGRNFEWFRPFFNELEQILDPAKMGPLLLNKNIGIKEILETSSKYFIEMKVMFTSKPLLSSTDCLNINDSQSIAFSWAPSVIKEANPRD